MIFIVVKAARMLGGALNGMRFGVPFHQHCECGEVYRTSWQDGDIAYLGTEITAQHRRRRDANVAKLFASAVELRFGKYTIFSSTQLEPLQIVCMSHSIGT